MQADAPTLPPGSSAAPAPGAWLWSRAAGGFVQVSPASFTLHAIAADPRFHALVRGERVEVAAPTFLLWAPDYVPADRIRHRGPVAAALDASTNARAPELWLDRKPYVFLRAGDADRPAWLGEHRSGRAVWFTYDGATLYALRDVGIDTDEQLVVDLERVAG